MEIIPDVKSMRFSSYWYNKGKRDLIYSLFNEMKMIKNKMSEYCFNNLDRIQNDRNFINDYKLFKTDLISAHTIQTLFSDIIKLYQNMLRSINFTIKIRSKYSQVNSKVFLNLISYLSKVNYPEYYESINDIKNKLESIDSETSKLFLDVFQELSEIKQRKILNIVNQIIKNKQIKLIKFNSGTFRLTASAGSSFEIINDKSNTLYQWFLKLNINRKTKLYLPLQISDKYFDSDLKFKKQILLIDNRQSNSKKLLFSIAYDFDYKFLDENYIAGIDINLTREKFLVASNGCTLEYSEEFIKPRLEKLEQFLKKGFNNLTQKDKRQYQKLIKSIQWYIEFKVSKFLNKLKSEGYSSIILEDLDSFASNNIKIKLFDKTFKLNIFTRFLRISGLKQMIRRLGINKGIKVHFIDSRYTSQQCPDCGNISRNNRKSQSDFKCTNCDYSANADKTAALNILIRFLNPEYFKKLTQLSKEFKKFNLFESRKFISNQKIKEILISNFKPSQDVLDSRAGLYCNVSCII